MPQRSNSVAGVISASAKILITASSISWAATRTAVLAVPGKSSEKCGWTTILCYSASFSKPIAHCRPVRCEKRGAVALWRYCDWSNWAPKPRPRPIAYCRASLKARRRGVTAVSVRRRFTASRFRFRGSATSGRLGRLTVLPQLKVDRLCSVVDGTAEFDP